jgi:hypothetical protein
MRFVVEAIEADVEVRDRLLGVFGDEGVAFEFE